MRLEEFDFHVPEELVAQEPLPAREASRLLVLHRKSGKIEHRRFLDLPEYLKASDTLVFNESKVIRARLLGLRDTGGKVEVFLLKDLGAGRYECLVKATAGQKQGLEFSLGDEVKGVIQKRPDGGMVHEVEFHARDGRLEHWLENLGKVPLPPYIHRDPGDSDVSRYQTVYAKHPGSVAAPTAGLHFSQEVLDRLRVQGVETDFVSLHVGLGTFLPIKAEVIEEHKMHEEVFHVPAPLREKCRTRKADGRQIVAVGTTSVRSLESAARGKEGSTDLFLKPGDEFRWVDSLFTNFHQPKSTLVVMLAAFVGNKELLFEAYRKAVEEKYRFFSYGDAMFVI